MLAKSIGSDDKWGQKHGYIDNQGANSRALATLLRPLIPKVGETSLSTKRSLSIFAKINLFFCMQPPPKLEIDYCLFEQLYMIFLFRISK
jgi:hypothetical protein